MAVTLWWPGYKLDVAEQAEACVEINSSMQQLTNVKYITSEQHNETNYERVARDAKDSRKCYSTYLK